MTNRNSRIKSIGRDPLVHDSKRTEDMSKEQFILKQKQMKVSGDRKPSGGGVHDSINASKERIKSRNPRLKGHNLPIRESSTANEPNNSTTQTKPAKSEKKTKDHLKEEIVRPTFEIEPRFKFVNKKPDFFNDRPYHPITKHIEAPGDEGTYLQILRDNNIADGQSVDTEKLKAAEDFVNRPRLVDGTRPTSRQQHISRKLETLMEDFGGKNLLVGGGFKHAYETGYGSRIRNICTYKEVSKMLKDKFNMEVEEDELAALCTDIKYGDKGYLTHSQLSSRITDILYPGYTNGRPDFFQKSKTGKRFGPGNGASVHPYNDIFLTHNMAPSEPYEPINKSKTLEKPTKKEVMKNVEKEAEKYLSFSAYPEFLPTEKQDQLAIVDPDTHNNSESAGKLRRINLWNSHWNAKLLPRDVKHPRNMSPLKEKYESGTGMKTILTYDV